MELILTGDRMEAVEAHQLGLVNRVSPPGEALAQARAMAEKIVAHSPTAVRESRALVQAAAELGSDQLWKATERAWQRVLAGPDASEGARAFAERRPPVWRDA